MARHMRNSIGVQEGFMVVIDGPDKIGKTTLCEGLLKRFGDVVFPLRFPDDGIGIGMQIRDMLNGEIPFNPYILQSWCYADKLNKECQIQYALQNGKLIICDRHIPSTLVYGKSDGLPEEFTKACVYGLTEANMTLILDRNEPFGLDGDIYEKAKKWKRLRDSYCCYAEEYGWTVVPVHDNEKKFANTVYRRIKDALRIAGLMQ